MKHRFREEEYFVLWDARRQLACIARHGLNLCQIRGPDCVEGYKLGYYALQLRDTRVLLRNVHYPFEGPSERAKLEQELESVDIARFFIDLGDFNSQPTWRIGDHVLMLDLKTWRMNAGSSTFVSCNDGARLSDCFCGLATISALEPVSGVQHRPVKLVVHVQALTSWCYKWVRGNHFLGVSNWDQSSMARLRELMVTDIDAAWKLWHLLAGGSAFPSRILRQCPSSAGWGSGCESERVARLWRGHRQAGARKTGDDDCREDAILEEISRILSENSKLAVAKWRDVLKIRGLAARWVKSRSITGVDLQHHVNSADEDHFEQCLASVPLVPRATHLATAKELATRWNAGVDELDRDLLGVQLSRIVDASFHSVNLVPCLAPVTVGDLPPGLVSVHDFHAETFHGSRIGPWRPGHIDRYAPADAPGLDAWDRDTLRSLDLQSETLLCELLDRLGTSVFPKSLLQARMVGIPKNDVSLDRRPLTVVSCIWRMWSRRIARHTGIWMDR